MPARHPDLLDHEPEQALPLFESQLVDPLPHPLCEGRQPASEAVGATELATLDGESLPLLVELSTAGGNLAFARLQLR